MSNVSRETHSINLERCDTKASVDLEISMLSKRTSSAETPLLYLAVCGNYNPRVETSLFKYFLECLVEIAHTTSTVFQSLQKIDFYYNLLIDQSEANQIIDLIKYVKQSSTEFKEFSFNRTPLSVEALALFSSFTTKSSSSTTTTTTTTTNQGRSLSLFNFCACEVSNNDNHPFSGVSKLILNSSLNSFPNAVSLLVEGRAVLLTEPKQAQLAVKAYLDVATQCRVIVQKICFSYSLIAVKVLEIFLSQNSNDSNTSLNDKSMNNSMTKIEYHNCVLLVPGENNEGNIELDGKFLFKDGHCMFSGIHVSIHQHAKLYGRLIKLVLDTKNAKQINFFTCKLVKGMLRDLLCPILEYNRNLMVKFNHCDFAAVVEHQDPIECMEWNASENSLQVMPDSLHDLEALGSILKLLVDVVPFTLITELVFNENEIDVEGMTYIVRWLNRTNIQRLSLYSCEMEDDCVKELTKALASTQSKLKYLDISENDNITANGIYCVLNLFRTGENMNLEEFEFDDSSIDEAMQEEINFYIALNCLGRKHLLKMNDLSACLLSLILAKADDNPHVVYWLLQRYPEYLLGRNQKISGHKRK